jgi:ribonuclease HII
LLNSCYKPESIEAGCDEAGRGCLAGPVVAAAVILPLGYTNNRINDSKMLSEKTRYELREEILAHALDYAVAFIDNTEIDRINILNASIKAMHNALEMLTLRPTHIIIDGNRFYTYKDIPHLCIVKGDSKYYSIAAASILAKTYRDDYMKQLTNNYAKYHWDQNKGYPTKAHREAIKEFGPCDLHRKTFKLTEEQLELNFEKLNNQ